MFANKSNKFWKNYYNSEKNKSQKKNFVNSKFNKSKNKGYTLVNRAPRNFHSVWPEKYVTKQMTMLSGFQNSSNPSVSIYIPLNRLDIPFSYSSFNAAGFNPEGNTTTPALTQYNDYTSITGIYSTYRISGSKIRLTVQPVSDAMTVGLAPTPVTTAYQVQKLAMQPYGKAIVVSAYNNVEKNTLSIYMPAHVACGMTKQEYMDQPPTEIGTAVAQNIQSFWNITIQDLYGNDFNATGNASFNSS